MIKSTRSFRKCAEIKALKSFSLKKLKKSEKMRFLNYTKDCGTRWIYLKIKDIKMLSSFFKRSGYFD